MWVYDKANQLQPQLDLYSLKTLPTILHALKIKDAEILSAVEVQYLLSADMNFVLC